MDGLVFGVYASKNGQSSEKVSVNMTVATLAQIDMLVDQGHYFNRSDFINQAVREALAQKQPLIERAIEQEKSTEQTWFLGIYGLEKKELLEAQASGEKLRIRGYGLLIISPELDELVMEVVESIQIRGKIRCSAAVKEKFGL